MLTKGTWNAGYGLIRPHQTLRGKTPAEEAGVNLNFEDSKWISLRKAAKNHNFLLGTSTFSIKWHVIPVYNCEQRES